MQPLAYSPPCSPANRVSRMRLRAGTCLHTPSEVTAWLRAHALGALARFLGGGTLCAIRPTRRPPASVRRQPIAGPSGMPAGRDLLLCLSASALCASLCPPLTPFCLRRLCCHASAVIWPLAPHPSSSSAWLACQHAQRPTAHSRAAGCLAGATRVSSQLIFPLVCMHTSC